MVVPLLLDKIVKFDKFTEENDPYGEHDFGMVKWYGEKVLPGFWSDVTCAALNHICWVKTVLFKHMCAVPLQMAPVLSRAFFDAVFSHNIKNSLRGMVTMFFSSLSVKSLLAIMTPIRSAGTFSVDSICR